MRLLNTFHLTVPCHTFYFASWHASPCNIPAQSARRCRAGLELSAALLHAPAAPTVPRQRSTNDTVIREVFVFFGSDQHRASMAHVVLQDLQMLVERQPQTRQGEAYTSMRAAIEITIEAAPAPEHPVQARAPSPVAEVIAAIDVCKLPLQSRRTASSISAPSAAGS
jgi:hypothetical protein